MSIKNNNLRHIALISSIFLTFGVGNMAQAIGITGNTVNTGSAPYIASAYVTNITKNSAELNGAVNPEKLATTAWFEISSTSSPAQSIGSGVLPVVLAPYIAGGLSQNTSYTFRIVANNSMGTTYGNWITFQTGGTGNANVFLKPTIVSGSASNITSNSATLNGSVNPNGSSTDAWFHMGPSSAGPLGGIQSIGSGTTAVTLTSYSLTGLSPNTSYSFRVEAVNTDGNAYGNWITFTTLSQTSGGGGGGGGGGGSISNYPVVTTQLATNQNQNGALLNATINPNSGNATAWFEYGTSASLSNYNQTSHALLGFGFTASLFSQGLSSLNPNTTYYFRAVANNSRGTVRGNILSFTTPGNINNVVINTNPNGGSSSTHRKTTTTITTTSNINPNETDVSADEFFKGENLSANALFGLGNILPKTMLGWIILLVLILIIIIIFREIYADRKNKKAKNRVTANHIENLPT